MSTSRPSSRLTLVNRVERTRDTGKRVKLTRADLTLDALVEYGNAVRDSTGCLKWLAARTKKVGDRGGYGVINLAGEKTQYVHRLAHWLTTGDEPPCVRHSCDTPMCFEPAHLLAGTVADNNADIRDRGRGRRRRATWSEVWMNVALDVGERSRCTRRAAGCVIVTSTNRIISTGFNGPPAGLIQDESMCTKWCPRVSWKTPPREYDNCVAAHAEINALMHSERERRYGGTAYVTTAPCYDCAKSLANSGLAWVRTRVLPQDWYRDPRRSVEFMMKCGIGVEVIG